MRNLKIFINPLWVITHAYRIARKEERRLTEVPTHREMLNELNWKLFKCIQFVSDRGIVDE
jgi:hypothetical protein